MSQRDQIARTLAEWAGWGWDKADRRKWQIAADRVMQAVVAPALADAWDEGYGAGELCGLTAEQPDHACPINPYEDEA